jgi:hypothetical protein
MNRMVCLLGVVTIAIPIFAGRVRAGEIDPNASTAKPTLPAFEVCRATVRVSGSARPGLAAGPLKVTVYLSDIMPRGPVNDQDITWAFEKYMTDEQGQLNAAEECRYAMTREEAQQIRDVEFRQGPGELTFVETGWQYQSAATEVAAPSTATAATAAATSTAVGSAAPTTAQYAVCWANTNPNAKYFSAVFDGSRDDASKWWPAFQKFLQEKYGFNGPTQCIPARAQADAESYLANLIDQAGQSRTAAAQPPQIVETGWTY